MQRHILKKNRNFATNFTVRTYIIFMENALRKHKNILLIAILALFAIGFALLVFFNYSNYRMSCLDYGLYTKTLYDYAHLRICDSSIFLWGSQPILRDHFDLYLVIFSPFAYLFGQYTLMIIQIIAVIFGGYGIYKLTELYSQKTWLALVATISFLSSFGIWHALSFDYHSNVVAAMLFPWLLYCFRKERYGLAFFVGIMMSLAKETIPLWLIFTALALMWDYRKNKKALLWLCGLLLYSAVYFIATTKFIMPLLGDHNPGWWRYEWLGRDFMEMASNLIRHPFDTLTLLVCAPNSTVIKPLKIEFYICCLASGLLLLCLKPNYLLMLIPMLAQKMFSADEGFWGVSYQYNIEIVTVLACGCFVVLSEFKKTKIQSATAILTVLLVIVTTFYTVGNPRCHIWKDRTRIFSTKHYSQCDFNKATLRRCLKRIPEDASVCANTFFVPRLACRDSIYVFPMGLAHPTEYFLLAKHHWSYYEGDETTIEQMVNDTIGWKIIDGDNDIVLLQRKKNGT